MSAEGTGVTVDVVTDAVVVVVSAVVMAPLLTVTDQTHDVILRLRPGTGGGRGDRGRDQHGYCRLVVVVASAVVTAPLLFVTFPEFYYVFFKALFSCRRNLSLHKCTLNL